MAATPAITGESTAVLPVQLGVYDCYSLTVLEGEILSKKITIFPSV